MTLALVVIGAALVCVDKIINPKEQTELLFKSEMTVEEFFKVKGWE